MDFTLTLNDDQHTIVRFEEGSNYHFNQHGLLVTVLPDGVERIYSPAAWSFVEDSTQVRRSG
jgi:hypothetical protein